MRALGWIEKMARLLKKIPRSAAIGLLFLSLGVAQAELPKQAYLPLDSATVAAHAALQKCVDDGYRVSVAVVDRSGVLRILLRGDGAGTHTVQSSFRKAYTAASLGRSTQEITNMIKEKPELEGLREMDNNILILAGGLPIKLEGDVVGGIGVGGAPGGNLDEACARAGLEKLTGK